MNTLPMHFSTRCCGMALAAFCGAALAQADPGMSKNPDAAGSAAPAMGAPKDPGSVKVPPPTGTEEMVTKPKNVDPGIAGSTGKIDRESRKKSERKPKHGQMPKHEQGAAPRGEMEPQAK